MLLAAAAHVGAKNLDAGMKEYVHTRRDDGKEPLMCKCGGLL